MTPSLFTIGLTGGIASGKTTVSCLFSEQGVPVIDADEISHALTRRGQPVLNEIAEYFGQEIIDAEGNLHRQKLREKVFKNSEQRKYLESILHPRIRQAMQEQMAQVKYPYCLLSIPLLIESQRQHTVSRVLVVDCPTTLQRERLKMRNQFDDVEITRILKAQVDRQTRLSAADDVIHNAGNMESLKFQVLNLHEKYLQLCEIKR